MKGNPVKIVEAMEGGADRIKVIAEQTGITIGVIRARMSELVSIGAVRAFRVRGGKRNRSQREKRYMLIRRN